MEASKGFLRSVWSALIEHLRSLSRRQKIDASIALLVLVILCTYLYVFAPPSNFSSGAVVRIAYGSSVPEIAQELADTHIIAHPLILRAILRAEGTGTTVQTGVYKFDTPPTVFAVAYRLITGDYGLPPVHITFIEGTTISDYAARVAAAFPAISAADFTIAAQGQEGYLFPDTYFFNSGTDAASIVARMRANFTSKITPLMPNIQASGHSISDVVIVASLVEKEARTPTDRRIVAGILWHRVALGMPLQVDAVFGYIFNRDTYSPSPADLKINSPYNTYLHAGLPPGPIDNPSLDSLEAAINPTKTTYLYYLTGTDGLMHYATTYAQHQANLKKYLD